MLRSSTPTDTTRTVRTYLRRIHRCPDFVAPPIPEVEVVDPLDDDIIQDELDREQVVDSGKEDQDDQDRKKNKDKKDKKRDARSKMLGNYQHNCSWQDHLRCFTRSCWHWM